MRVHVKRGSEGPRHDPYSYTRITVTRWSGNIIVGHFGLGCWVEVNGYKIAENNDTECGEIFTKFAGLTPSAAESIPETLRARAFHYMSKKEREVYMAMEEIDEKMLRNAY